MTPEELRKEMRKSRKNWCFTLNNPTSETFLWIAAMLDKEMMTTASIPPPLHFVENVGSASSTSIQHMICGLEVSPTTGTPHLQGYLQLKKKMRGSALKKLMPPRSILIATNGSSTQNTTYCKKEGSWKSWGILGPGQGARTDLVGLKKMIDDGCDERSMADSCFSSFLKYRSSLMRYRQLVIQKRRDWMPQIFIYWGVTGTGKTSKIFEDEGYDVWVWNGNNKFYQGYDMQDVAVFDDFYGEISLPFMLKLCDRYPMIVNIKNGECNWQPKKIYFTSNVDPRDWEGWREQPQAVKDAFFRRVNEMGGITHFAGDLMPCPDFEHATRMTPDQ